MSGEEMWFIWLAYLIVSLSFYALGRTDEEKMDGTGIIALTVTNAIFVTVAIAKIVF